MLLTTLAGWPAKPAPGSLDLAILKGYLSSTTREKLEAVDGWPSLDTAWQEAVVAAANYVWLLIDEVDRADEAFEAYLLELLSDFQLSIPELGTVRAVTRPLVVITSNGTRELSDALRRRCLYQYIDYPDYEKELAIVRAALDEALAGAGGVITITGATGFAGRHAVSELLLRGHRLRALVRSPEKAGLPEGVELVKGDLADAEALLERLG